MTNQRRRLALLFCGGTTLHEKDGPGDSVRTERDIPRWLDNFSELKLIADIEPHFIYGGKAAGIGKREWLKITEIISRRLTHVDGFLVVHGLDTLPYTANILSFLIQRPGKTVALTGSAIPGRTEQSSVVEASYHKMHSTEVRANMVNSVQVALSDIGEVVVVFGNRILRASRTTRVLPPSISPFDTQDNSVLGKIDFGVRLFEKHLNRSSSKPKIAREVDTRVAIFNWYPGVDTSLLKQSLGSALHGVIIQMPETNYIPDEVYHLLSQAQKRGVVVVLYTATGPKRLKQADFIVVDRMTLTATLTKLMWILGQTRSLSKIKKALLVPVALEQLNT